MRGLRLHRERGSEIVTYLDGTYGVPSRTEEGVLYVVDLDAETCECPDKACRKDVTCLHAVAAEAKRREAARKAAPKPPARKRCSAPPMAVRSKMARDFLSRMGAA